MKQAELKSILNNIANVKIGLIGDFCLDVYWHMNERESEISVETNLPTQAVETQKYSLGGAGNVANNLLSLGVKDIEVFGVVGEDPFGHQMHRIMEKLHIHENSLITQEKNWSSHVYIKPINDNKEGNRVDFGNYNCLAIATSELLLSEIEKKISDLDIVIINQQVICGIHNFEFFRKGLQKIINSNPNIPFILDSRSMSDKYTNCLHKINAYEATALCGANHLPNDLIPLSETQHSMLLLYKKWQKPIFVTRGSRGCLIEDEDGNYCIPGLHFKDRIDTVGAGDSMLAGIAACLAAKLSPLQAATFGNLCAGVTVQKLYCTGTATPEEIIELGKHPHYIDNIE